MKTFISYSFCLLLSVLATTQVNAKPVDAEKAQKIAKQFLSSEENPARYVHSLGQTTGNTPLNTSLNLRDMGGKYVSEVSKNPLFHVFTHETSGFIIVSGDDLAQPILAYSTQETIDPNSIPPNLQSWLEGYCREIEQAVVSHSEQDPKTAELWDELSRGDYQTTVQPVVDTLIQTKWGQSPYYNNFCPYDSTLQQRTVTGCVATAMAQIMRYWAYPTKGLGRYTYIDDEYGVQEANFGTTSYLWDQMPIELGSGSTNQEDDAVALLMYHCGVSVDMNYGVNGSSSDWNPQTLMQHFGYATTAKVVKKAESSDNAWKRLIKSELDAQRPMLYGGYLTQGKGGHAWVCDGYDSEDRFHMNWGWSGNGNGFYNLSALTTHNGDLSKAQDAVVGIQPATTQGAVALELFSPLTVSPTTIRGTELFSVAFNVKNISNSSFKGQIAAGVYDSDNQWICDVGPAYEENDLPAGYHYKTDLNWTSNNISLPNGSYSIRPRYKKLHGENWETIAGGTHLNSIDLKVSPASSSTEADLTLYRPLQIGDQNIIVQNTPFTLSLNVANFSASTFTGAVEVDFYSLSGDYMAEIPTLYHKDINALKPNTAFSQLLSTTVQGIDIEPGDYLVGVTHQRSGDEGWKHSHPGNDENPVKVRVQMGPDKYEPNDDTETPITLSFSEGQAIWSSSGSNLHHSDDFDFYGMTLPSAYDYLIDIRAHDSWNSGNGKQYGADVLWVMLTSDDGECYSDDIMTEPYLLRNGGWAMIGVSSLDEGTGTYELEVNIKRVPTGNSGALSDLRSTSIPLYHFYRNDNGSYFFTADEREKETITNQYSTETWEFEGVSHRVSPSPALGTVPVFRIYDTFYKTHWYTASIEEKDRWLAEDVFLKYEGIAFHTPQKQITGAQPVYRFFSPLSNTQYFTISKSTRDRLIETADPDILNYEGIAWYGFE